MKSLLYLTLLLMMLFYPDLYIPAAYNALKIWGLDVVPSLFPYMVFCRLLASQMHSTRIPPVCTSAFLGLLGGSPSGASVLSVFGEKLSRQKLLMLTALTGTISPTFLLSTVRLWVRNAAFAKILFACHLFSAAMAAILVYILTHKHQSYTQLPEKKSIFAEPQDSPVRQSIDAILNIGGCIIICSVVSIFICKNPLFSSHPYLSACIHALIEMSGGIHALSSLPDIPMRAYLIAAASGFSGLSILIQNAYFLRPIGISMNHQILLGLLRAAISVLSMAVCRMLFT